MGVDFSLYVSGKKYESWLNLLKGLVMAKESEGQKWRRSRIRYRNGRRLHPAASTPAMRASRSRCQSTTYRARSTSPLQYTRPPPAASATTRPHLHINPPPSPSPNPGSKRSAADAFSPTSTSFNELPPLKRPTGMTLHIPENGFSTAPSSSSPLEPLQSFAKMSLSTSSSSPHRARTALSVQPTPAMRENRPQTLVAAYRVERPVNVPRVRCFPSFVGKQAHFVFAESLLLFSGWVIHRYRRTGPEKGSSAVLPTSSLDNFVSTASIVYAYGHPVRFCEPTRELLACPTDTVTAHQRCDLVAKAPRDATSYLPGRQFLAAPPVTGKCGPLCPVCQRRSAGRALLRLVQSAGIAYVSLSLVLWQIVLILSSF